MNLPDAHDWLYEALNSLCDPHDACDFDGGEVEALKRTINDAISCLRKVEDALDFPLPEDQRNKI